MVIANLMMVFGALPLRESSQDGGLIPRKRRHPAPVYFTSTITSGAKGLAESQPQFTDQDGSEVAGTR